MRGMRRHERFLLDAPVQVCWTNANGGDSYARCRCMNISESGIRLDSPQAIPLRTSICFQVDGEDFRGTAWVRSCTRVGMNYHLGLEFGGGLKWRRPPSKPDPAPAGVRTHK